MWTCCLLGGLSRRYVPDQQTHAFQATTEAVADVLNQDLELNVSRRLDASEQGMGIVSEDVNTVDDQQMEMNVYD